MEMLEIVKAKRSPVATIFEKTFVDATAYSGPAWRYAPFPVNLARVEPITLHIELMLLPCFLASIIASMVSLVSPDCDIPMVRVFAEHTDFAGNSLAMKASNLTEENILMYEEIISAA